ncbi:hypothetical protein [Nocardia sp. NPDC056100]|uniref:hypothetical protein n=1 Tax=Nocardia sp. NPDC056100 TaxID=3345712 RepID=UPI0035E12B87
MRKTYLFAVLPLLAVATLSALTTGPAAAANGCGNQLADWGPAANTAHYTGSNQAYGTAAIDLTRASDITATVTQSGFVTAVYYPIATVSVSGTTLTASQSGDQLTMTATDCNSAGKVVAANAKQQSQVGGATQILWQGKVTR